MYKILDGRAIAQKIKNRLKKKVQASKLRPGLAVVFAGSDPASLSYIRAKERAAQEIDVQFFFYKLPSKSLTKHIVALIEELNQRKDVHGVIVQLPLPKHLNRSHILNAIALEKDVDVLSDQAKKLFENGRPVFVPPPASAAMELIKQSGKRAEQSVVTLVGHGILVGKPIETLLSQKAKTLFVCDQKTQLLSTKTRKADILISAVGKPNLITASMVKKGAVLIDAGTSRHQGKIVGDVDFDRVAPKTSFITPVPGGVGPVTVAMLIANVVKAALSNSKKFLRLD
ncbi:MAG TPA: bifunctional 5,10-methylenetetrahydrofolate dehydrogenase/5,10-methenyltetrahydrofolate cyclohydrolase [Patescibacteria group bacterium]|nr:bifunctional 5,10-methylenetetrahydrofolate dehydrogenase/5,10-methenyltetrahydrofolate cyclohydrolase [Patescibacteria group bacterium]